MKNKAYEFLVPLCLDKDCKYNGSIFQCHSHEPYYKEDIICKCGKKGIFTHCWFGYFFVAPQYLYVDNFVCACGVWLRHYETTFYQDGNRKECRISYDIPRSVKEKKIVKELYQELTINA